MSAEKKLEILRSVEGSGVPVIDALTKMEISPSTYYRWRRRFRTGGRESLHNRKPHRERNWNQLPFLLTTYSWWSQAIEGDTDKPGAVFYYHYQDVHRCTFKITEFVPGRKVVWHVLQNYFNFVKDKTEWTGTDVVFEIARKGDRTEVHFTHVGLVPASERYGVCSDAWGSYITGSLRDLIATGKGKPNPIEEIVTRARQMSRKAS